MQDEPIPKLGWGRPKKSSGPQKMKISKWSPGGRTRPWQMEQEQSHRLIETKATRS